MPESNDKDKLLAFMIHRLAIESSPHLISTLHKQEKLADACYAIKSRTKSPEALVSKKNEKRKIPSKLAYEITDITDVIGIRFVSLFRQQMCLILNEVLSLLCKKDQALDFDNSPFANAQIEEIIIYKGNTKTDPIFDEIRHIAEQFEQAKEKISEDPKSSGYSSIHVVARLNRKQSSNPELNDYNLPIEIQIRTVFEDAWGEIEHQYGYKAKPTKGKELNRSPAVIDHLTVLKQFADSCASYANNIHKEVNGHYASNIKKGIVKSVMTNDEIDRFSELGVTSSLIEKYSAAKTLKYEADTASDNQKRDLAISEFRWLTEHAGQEPKLFIYYTKMNEAICHLARKEPASLYTAKELYMELKSEYPNYPMVNYRLGQTYDKLNIRVAADDQFDDAWVLIHELKDKGMVGTDQLPQDDYDYIAAWLPSLKGYSRWLESQKEKDPQRKTERLLEAYNITAEAFNAADNDALKNAHNNSIYYLYELWDLNKSDEWKKKGESHAKFLESQSDYMETEKLEWLDTISKFFRMYGETQRAIETANKIKQLILDGNTGVTDSDEVLTILQEAANLIRDLTSINDV